MDHLLRRVGLVPTLKQYNAYTLCKEISKSDFPQFLGSLPCTKRSIERHLFPLIYQHIVSVTSLSIEVEFVLFNKLSFRTGIVFFPFEIPDPVDEVSTYGR